VDQEAIVEANGSIGFDEFIVDWTDSNFRDLHNHSNPKVTASTRWVTLSIDLAFCTYPATRAMTAQEPMIATANQTIP
jgi:hypothetical protein